MGKIYIEKFEKFKNKLMVVFLRMEEKRTKRTNNFEKILSKLSVLIFTTSLTFYCFDFIKIAIPKNTNITPITITNIFIISLILKPLSEGVAVPTVVEVALFV